MELFNSMAKNNKTAVLLSTYNGERFVEKQIESIIKQDSFRSIDFIIRDDGSKDATVTILRKYERNYSNIKVLVGHNIGLVPSFFNLLHYGYEHDYEYYAFCDQDDYWLPDKISSAINKIQSESSHIPLLYGTCSWLVDDKLTKSKVTTQKMQRNVTFYNAAIQNIFPGHTQVINKQLARILLSKTEDFSKVYSQDLWFIAAAATTGKVVSDNIPHVLYRMHGNNELGYGKGKMARLYSHLLRLRKKEPQKMAIQLQYFAKQFNEYLDNNQKDEILNFFQKQSTLKNRIDYTKNTRLYRQTSKETALFKILYVMGFYNVD